MKVLMISGSYPPDVCGVGDYTYNLVQALEKQAVEVMVLCSTDTSPTPVPGPAVLEQRASSWSPLCAITALRHAIADFQPDIIHFQYPTIGFGHRLGPHAAAVYGRLKGRNVIVTVHESKKAHILRRISLLAFNFCVHILTTTSAQAGYLRRVWFYPLRDKISVIPIASNIPRAAVTAGTSSLPVCTHFGLIYPNKGIDTFIEVARQSRLTFGPQLRFRIVGNVHPAYLPYFECLRKDARDLNIEWVLGSSPEEVARLLYESLVCILPFSDGASYRRGSLLAALVNGVPVITTSSAETPDDLIHGYNIYFAGKVEEYIQYIGELLDPETHQSISERCRQLGQKFDWDHIAELHQALFRRLITARAVSTKYSQLNK